MTLFLQSLYDSITILVEKTVDNIVRLSILMKLADFGYLFLLFTTVYSCYLRDENQLDILHKMT